MIQVQGDRLMIRFDQFDTEAYQTFLNAKRLPEYQIDVDDDLNYTIDTPARFANLLGVETPERSSAMLPFPEFLFDDQTAIVKMAIEAKRFACWSDCGFGKTLIQLEWARQVHHLTGGRVLILTLNDIVEQTIEEAENFYGSDLPILKLQSRDAMREWCKEGDGIHQIAITNYEKMNPDDAGQTVNEWRYLAGLALDEASRLKAGGGKQKWAIIKSAKGIEYKLAATATPAPNDTMEFASQASFLERMRSEGEIIWTYFIRDPKTKKWTVKQHAKAAFFEFMASWSIYLRDPRKYGWRKGWNPPPPPKIHVHQIESTEQQREALKKVCTEPNGQVLMFGKDGANAIERNRLSQIGKGFLYHKGGTGKYDEIVSNKPAIVAGLVASEVRSGRPTLVWTVFDAEAKILERHLRQRGISYLSVTGSTPKAKRADIVRDFKNGRSMVLLSRTEVLGFGINLQRVQSMIFSGWNDSYEKYYQAIRRAYRHGQEHEVQVHLPCVSGFEDDQLENVFSKEAKHLAAIDQMEANYIQVIGGSA